MNRRFNRWTSNMVKGIFLALPLFAASLHADSSQTQKPFFESGIRSDNFFLRAKPKAVGIKPTSLELLIRDAEANHSHALIVIKDGRVVTERYFGHPQQPIHINSVTKSIVSLAVGLLLGEKKISSINAPLSTWFPQWAEDTKAKVTLWNVLTHTSGLYHDQSAEKLSQQKNVVYYALDLSIIDTPGKTFSYSNEAVALLPGIVSSAAGKPLEVYLKEKVFDPLGISNWAWDRDKDGNVKAYGGLWMLPRDLARVGQLMLNSGRWKEKQLVPASWVQASTSQARDDIPFYGLLWWLYQSQKPNTPVSLQKSTDSTLSVKISSTSTIGFGGDGWLGQYLVIYPQWHLVAVRMHSIEAGNDIQENEKYGFPSFPQRVLDLVQP
jgi:CubicO group peptidase (beta-lactamase class C family)